MDASSRVDAAFDAGMDATVSEAGPDARTADAGVEGGLPDGGTDAGALDGGRDALVSDAGVDAGTDAGSDAGSFDAGPTGVCTPSAGCLFLECVSTVVPNETMSGMVLSANFWPGFRFQIPTGGDRAVRRIEVNLRSGSASAGTIFTALVRLTGPSDTPDASDLTGADVLTTLVIAVPGGTAVSKTVGADTAITVPAGWYAAVFGTGAFGGTLATATVHSNFGGGMCGGGFGYPFSIRQSDGMFILQSATPHMAVEAWMP